MPDVIAPPAVAAPTSTAPAAAPAGGPPPAAPQLPKVVKPTAPVAQVRGPDGKFTTPGGKPAVEPAAPTEAEKEAYRFKRKVTVYGKEEALDLSEDDIARELQISRALQRQAGKFKESQTQAQRLFQLAKEHPELFLQEAGHDPDELARRRLAQQAKLSAMTPEERDAHDAKAENAKLKTELETRDAREKAAAYQTELQAHRQANVKEFTTALSKVGMEPTYETLYLMAETKKLAMENGLQLTADQVATETGRRIDTFAERYLSRLDAKSLVKRLGPQRIQAILQETLKEFEASQVVPGTADAPPPAAEPSAGPREYIDEQELNRRMRDLRMGKL